MSGDALAKIWTTLGVVSFYVSVNALLRVQGSEVYFPGIDFGDAGRYPVAVYGLGATLVPYVLLLYTTNIYATSYGGRTPASSLPIAFSLAIAPDEKHSRAYQWGFFFFFLVCPVVCRILLLRKMFAGPVFRREGGMLVAQGIKKHLGEIHPLGVIFTNDFVMADSWPPPAAATGVTYFPFWQPWFFVLIEVGIWILGAIVVSNVLCRGRSGTLSLAAARRLRGSGWDGNLDEMRGTGRT